ncbi:MAG: PAS domain S-box protein [Candidatus Lokiarchaeota archaeon]
MAFDNNFSYSKTHNELISIDILDDLILIVENQYNLEIKQLNEEKFHKLLGYNRKDLINCSFLELIADNHKRKILKFFNKQEYKKGILNDIKVKKRNNETFWCDLKVKIIENDHSYNGFLLLTLKDITERRKLSEKYKRQSKIVEKLTREIPEIRFWKLLGPKEYKKVLAQSYEMIQKVIDNIPMFIYWKDQDLDFLGCNDKFTRFIGFKKSQNIIKIKNDNKPILHKLEKWISNQGAEILLDVNRIPIQDNEGNFIGLIISCEDVTEIRKKEAELKKEKVLMERVMETSLAAIIMIDKDGHINYTNPQAENVFEFEESKNGRRIYTSSMQNFIDYQGNPFLEEELPFNKVKKTKKPVLNVKYAIKKSNEDLKYLIVNSAPLFNENGNFDGMVSIVEDASGKVKAEKMLSESEEKYRHLFESSPYAIGLFDLDGKLLDCNDTINYFLSTHKKEDILGLSYKQILSNNPKNIYLINQIEDFFKNVKSRKKSESLEFEINRSNGKRMWVNLYSSLINIDEKPLVQTIIQNITGRKLAEKELKESEEKFRTITEQSLIGIGIMRNGVFLYVNQRIANIFGYTYEDIRNFKPFEYLKLVSPKDRDKVRIFMESKETGEDPIKNQIVFRGLTKQGKTIWIENFSKTIIYNGKTSNLIALEDITEKKIFENLIYELNIVFLNFTTDFNKNIQTLLKTCCKLLNSPFSCFIHKEKVDNKLIYQLITSEGQLSSIPSQYENNYAFFELFKENHDYPQLINNLEKKSYFKTDPYLKEHNLKGMFGKLIKSEDVISDALCVFFNERTEISDEEQLVLFIISDATEIEQRRWQAQQRLEERNIVLSDMNNLKSELLSRTSHELKTPLISIKGFTDLLLTIHNSKLDSEMKSILNEIKQGSKRLEDIINNLIKSSKLDSDDLELNLSEEDLNFLINFCINELKGISNLRNQNIIFNPKGKLTVKIDKERMYEVISNLIVNAIKYTPPGGIIKINSLENEKEILVAVSDNGIGLTKEDKEKLFTQFGKIERYGQGWDLGIEGSGLGLYISKKIIELHGGKIWVESEGRNKGSIFYFSLPKKD